MAKYDFSLLVVKSYIIGLLITFRLLVTFYMFLVFCWPVMQIQLIAWPAVIE